MGTKVPSSNCFIIRLLWKEIVIINNSTNIIKMNNHHTAYGIGNPGPVLGQAHCVNGIPTLPF